jgi:hypothetical protein
MFWTVEPGAAAGGGDKDRRFVKIVESGVYNVEDHIRMLEDLVSRDFWTPGTNILLDELALDYRGTTLEQLREAAARRVRMDALIGGGKVAALMKSIPDFVRARQYELITDGKISARIRVFRDEAEAIKWLLAEPN